MGLARGVRASEARHKKRGRAKGNIAYTREEVEEMLNSGLFEKINKGGILQVVPSRARSGYISLKRHSKATGGRTTFEAKMEGSKANSFKSPAGAEHSMVVRKLAMTARSQLGD